jgi:hypothetical protein
MNFDFIVLRNRLHFILFAGSILWLSFYYDLDRIYQMPPYSVHLWRQTDGTSIALNYYQDGLPFFKPRMHNILTTNGQSVGEFPVLYYLAGLSYRLFGVNEGYFRLLSLSILVAGIYSFFLTLRRYSGNLFFALPAGLLLYLSPLNVFYGFNFLPDAPALGLTLLGWYYFFRYFDTTKRSFFFAGIAFFLLAGLIKVTMLTSFVAFICLYLLIQAKILRKEENLTFHHKGMILPGIAIILLAVTGWYWWALHYNTIHSSYLLMDIKPIWELDRQNVIDIYDRIITKWYFSYFHISILCFLAISFITSWMIRKPVEPFFKWFLLLITAGVIANAVLWFGQLYHHDYYVITWMILPAAILLCLSRWIANTKIKWIPGSVSFLLFLLVIQNAIHCKSLLDYRYDPKSVYNVSQNPAYFKTKALHAYIRSLGIKPEDKVISLPDTSPNTSLYLMNLRGHTNYDYITPYTHQRIDSLVQKGFKYLIIGDSTLLNDTKISSALTRPIGVFDNSLYFFRIQ